MENYNVPDLIYLEEFGGNYNNFEKEVYTIFKNDFVHSKPNYLNKRFALKKHPMNNEREATYYHITSEGYDEANRTPDLRRMERIRFSRSFIDNHDKDVFKVWENKRKGKTRILILNEEERFLVILEDRGDFVLLWTCYYIEHGYRLKKYLKEYDAYINAETA